jgi:hypothetical protein
LKEAIEDSFLFEALYNRSHKKLLSLEGERARLRDKVRRVFVTGSNGGKEYSISRARRGAPRGIHW